MAKKASRKGEQDQGALSDSDRRTLKTLLELANEVVQTADRGRAPYLDIPSRSLSNVRYNRSKRFIEMGSGKNRRELFNLSQAKQLHADAAGRHAAASS